MCQRCDYRHLLVEAGLEPNDNRLAIMEVIGGNRYPLTAPQVHQALARTQPINKVTVYRILDLLVAGGVLEKLNTSGRAAFYGLAPNEHHEPHPHFYCTSCGQMDCLNPESLEVGLDQLQKIFPGRIDRIEVRVDGICRSCLKHRSSAGRA